MWCSHPFALSHMLTLFLWLSSSGIQTCKTKSKEDAEKSWERKKEGKACGY